MKLTNEPTKLKRVFIDKPTSETQEKPNVLLAIKDIEKY